MQANLSNPNAGPMPVTKMSDLIPQKAVLFIPYYLFQFCINLSPLAICKFVQIDSFDLIQLSI